MDHVFPCSASFFHALMNLNNSTRISAGMLIDTIIFLLNLLYAKVFNIRLRDKSIDRLSQFISLVAHISHRQLILYLFNNGTANYVFLQVLYMGSAMTLIYVAYYYPLHVFEASSVYIKAKLKPQILIDKT